MKMIWQDFVWRLLGSLLIIFFGGWIVGSVLNFAGMANPQIAGKVSCPEGSTATWQSNPDQRGSTISCHDQNGHLVPALSDAESVVLQRKYFYRPSFISMVFLATGWFIWSSIRQVRNQGNT
jgi:hypothetical protein